MPAWQAEAVMDCRCREALLLCSPIYAMGPAFESQVEAKRMLGGVIDFCWVLKCANITSSSCLLRPPFVRFDL